MSSPNNELILPLRKRSLALCLTALLGTADLAPAADPPRPDGAIVVTNCADSGPGSLRDAVDSDVSELPIDLSGLSCSTITLASGAIQATRPLTLIGPGSTHLAIDGNHNGAVLVEGADGAALSVTGITVQNGYVIDGNGGCIFSAGPVALDDVVISGCKVTGHGSSPTQRFSGGGIEVRGNLTATDSRIVGNSLSVSTGNAQGGGARVSGLVATLVNTTVSENSAAVVASSDSSYGFAVGGGIYAEHNVSMTRGTINNNTASSVVSSSAGGIWSNGFLSMTYSSVSGNSAQEGTFGSYGGGLSVADTTYIDHSTISDNFARNVGGVEAGSLSSVFVTNSTISANSASAYAGISAGNVYAYNSTIAFNDGTRAGYCNGVCVSYNADLVSSIVTHNLSANEERANVGTRHLRLLVYGHNDVIGPSANDVTFPEDTITADPMLAPLSDNGGPTLTHALLPGSPAIDTGFALNGVDWDQRGEGYPRAIGVGVDIGAYEAPLSDQAPIATNDAYTTSEDAELVVDAPGVLANDTDADGDALSAVLVDGVSNGALTLQADGSLVYVPIPGFFGTDTFTYQVTDGVTSSNIATVTIEVQEAVNNDLIFNNGFD